MEETWLQSLGQEYPLEKGMATHSTKVTRQSPGLTDGKPRCGDRMGSELLMGENWNSELLDHKGASY